MAFDVNNFVVNRFLRGTMFDTNNGKMLWSINQINDPSLTMSADETQAVDAIGVEIMSFERAKNAEFSASNALFDLGLLAAQAGTKKVIASGSAKITAPRVEEIEITEGMTEVILKEIPVGTSKNEIPFIYALNGDNTLGEAYTLGAAATATTFALNAATKTLTIPTGLTKGTRLFVMYEYETEEAVEVSATAKDFPKAGKFVLEVLGADVCNVSKVYHAYLIFPQAKLMSNFDLTLNTEMTHPFTLKAMQEYCDYEKRLFRIVIPNED